MSGETLEYNPLDYTNLTRNCVEELMCSTPKALPLDDKFQGAGVYALFYRGELPYYSKIRSGDATCPIYVGKAVPPGARKGAKSESMESPLLKRISEHTASIEVCENLSTSDFLCRYLVVTQLWITMAERFLIEHYQPLWNVCIEGFGNHNPGKGRLKGEITWWDTLHPGQPWAASLVQSRTMSDAKERLKKYTDEYSKREWQMLREHKMVYRTVDDGEFPE